MPGADEGEMHRGQGGEQGNRRRGQRVEVETPVHRELRVADGDRALGEDLPRHLPGRVHELGLRHDAEVELLAVEVELRLSAVEIADAHEFLPR